MTPTFPFYLEAITHFLMLLIMGVYAWKFDNRFRYRMLAGFYLVATALLIQPLSQNENIHVHNALYLFTGLVFAGYFFAVLQTSWRSRLALALALPTLLYFVYQLVGGGYPWFDSMGYALASISIVIMIFLYFHEMLHHVTETPLLESFDFWLICGWLMYHLGAFGIFLTYSSLTQTMHLVGESYISTGRDLFTYLWGLNNVLLFLSALVAATGLGWKIYHRSYQL